MLVVTKSFIGRVKFGQKEDAGVYTWIAYPNDQYAMHSAVIKVTSVGKNREAEEEEKKQSHAQARSEAVAEPSSVETKPAVLSDTLVAEAPAPARAAAFQPFKQFELFLN